MDSFISNWHAKLIMGLLTLLIQTCSHGQQVRNFLSEDKQLFFKPLIVGDSIPNISLGKFINQTNSWKFSDLRGKLVIIDFWATWCIPCVKGLYVLDSLQKRFQKEIVIIPVNTKSTGDTKEKIIKIFKDQKFNLPTIFEDTVLSKMFPHAAIPHEVWISSDGIVKAITSQEEMTVQNIEAVLKNNSVSLGQKNDNLKWDWSIPLGGVEVNSDFLYRSILVKFNPGIPSGSKFDMDSNRKIKRMYCFNSTPLQMIFKAYSHGKILTINPKRIIVNIKDSLIRNAFLNSKFRSFIPNHFPYCQWKTKEQWRNENLFTYELILPNSVSDSTFYSYMLQDLNRLFQFKGKHERKKVDCWILVSIDSTEKLLQANQEISSRILTNQSIGVRNMPLDDFVDYLNNFSEIDPIINETGIKGNVDIEINFSQSKIDYKSRGLVINSPLDITVAKKELNRFGLDIIRSGRFIDMLIIY